MLHALNIEVTTMYILNLYILKRRLYNAATDLWKHSLSVCLQFSAFLSGSLIYSSLRYCHIYGHFQGEATI